MLFPAFLSLSFFIAKSSTAFEKHPPVLNDAITTNDTLAATRNAFLIRHLFIGELDGEEGERDQKDMKSGKNNGNSRITDFDEADDEGTRDLYAQLKGNNHKDDQNFLRQENAKLNIFDEEEIGNSQVKTQIGTTTMLMENVVPPTNNDVGNGADDDEKRGMERSSLLPPLMPIKPINSMLSDPRAAAVTQRHLNEKTKNADPDEDDDSSPTSSKQKPAEEHEAPVAVLDEKQATTAASSTISTNGGKRGSANVADEQQQHLDWLRPLFYTVLSQ